MRINLRMFIQLSHTLLHPHLRVMLVPLCLLYVCCTLLLVIDEGAALSSASNFLDP